MLRKFGIALGVIACSLQATGLIMDVRESDVGELGHTLFLVGTGLLLGAVVLFALGSNQAAGQGRAIRVLVPIVPMALVGVGLWAANSDAVVPDHAHPVAAAEPAAATRCDLDFNTAEFNFSSLSLAATATHDHSHEGVRNAASPDDTGHGGHEGPQAWDGLTDPAQCETLRGELDIAKKIAETYPTAADATKAGWVMVTPYVAKIGAHYMRFEYVDGEFDINEPEMLLYDGNSPESNMIGLSYYIVKSGTEEPTVGFTGNNDHYHRHVGLCLKGTMVIGGESMPKEVCEAIGGKKSDGGDRWMSHVWVVPGCESDWGVFSGDNPALTWDLAANAGKPDKTGCGSGKKVTDDLDFQTETDAS